MPPIQKSRKHVTLKIMPGGIVTITQTKINLKDLNIYSFIGHSTWATGVYIHIKLPAYISQWQVNRDIQYINRIVE